MLYQSNPLYIAKLITSMERKDFYQNNHNIKLKSNLELQLSVRLRSDRQKGNFVPEIKRKKVFSMDTIQQD